MARSVHSSCRMANSLMIRLLLVLAIIVALPSCVPPPEYDFEAVGESLEVNAKIGKPDLSFKEGHIRLFGDVEVSNHTGEIQSYSNRWLYLTAGDSIRERAYLDSVTSNVIDVSTVEIKPGETLSLSLYWVLPASAFDGHDDEDLILVIESEDQS